MQSIDLAMGSNALGPSLLRAAFGDYGSAQASTKIFGQLVKLRITVDLNGLLRGVTDHVAIVAPGKMVVQLGLCALVDDPIEIVGQLLQKFRAFHWLSSPLACLGLPSALSRL